MARATPQPPGMVPRSWMAGGREWSSDHGMAWRVRLLPDLLARSRAREAARGRGPPGRSRDHGMARATPQPPGMIPRSWDSLGHVPTVPRMIHDHGTAWATFPRSRG